jgi:hypothetical protein
MKAPSSTTQTISPHTVALVPAPALHPVGPQAASSRTHLRLTLSASIGVGPLDGAWWPRSTNLEAELAELVDHFPAKSGRIVHAVFSVPDWRPAHRRIKVKRGIIKVGSFPRDDSHRIMLSLSSREILQLMVVPPHSSPSLALAVMARATSPSNCDSAATILNDAQQSEAADAATRSADDGRLCWKPRPPRNVR